MILHKYQKYIAFRTCIYADLGKFQIGQGGEETLNPSQKGKAMLELMMAPNQERGNFWLF